MNEHGRRLLVEFKNLICSRLVMAGGNFQFSILKLAGVQRAKTRALRLSVFLFEEI
jgi:hypothetical protein